MQVITLSADDVKMLAGGGDIVTAAVGLTAAEARGLEFIDTAGEMTDDLVLGAAIDQAQARVSSGADPVAFVVLRIGGTAATDAPATPADAPAMTQAATTDPAAKP